MTRPTSFDDLPLVMTIEDVAEILQVSKSTTYQLARSEQLRSTMWASASASSAPTSWPI